ncbi:thyrotroph embryonic factor isoform X2 [Diorhabda carinulata]|uniref:thyrotroph embryonic factor isoform X2 n=1 Tax=Diorhabda sublineata TaxID=1163346 RepID=UPI0024E16FEF|nr:thyrotroph embryonic factor isoform X2 [Diorhabda sublineata]XP_057669718.1 thyrotroph embryonic factor isoform X2 [Diorhabda carinulata]
MSFVVPVKEMEYQLPAPPISTTAAPAPLGHQVPVGVMQGTLTHVQAPQQDESHRWTQYQQLWRQHVYMNGNSKPPHSHSHGHTTIKDLAGSILGDDKNKDDGELWNTVEAQTAFLGPNLWDKTYETDLKYVDLDEFLSENGVSMDGLGTHSSLGPLNSSQSVPKRERSPSPSDCMSPDTMNPPSPADSNFSEALSMASSCRDFDPRKRVISDEDLKPQPLIKKSRKQFVPDDLKDDKYWARRRKNNLAAKRSRDARRMKENQIALRAGYLEKENVGLRQELERMKKENLILKNKLSKYEDV